MPKRSSKSSEPRLSRRERQIMDAIHRRGRATAADVRDDLEDPPSYSAVRALLRVLEEKGHLRHQREGNKYVYEPTESPEKTRRSALRHLLRTFFGDSPSEAMAAMLDDPSAEYSEAELQRMAKMIRDARKEGR